MSSTSRSISSTMLQLVRAYDPEGWNRLVEVWGPVVYEKCRRHGVRPSDAQDIVQEVFLQVARSVGTFEHKTFRGWIATITARKIADHYRHSRNSPSPAVGGSSEMRRIANLADPFGEQTEEFQVAGFEGLIAHQALHAIRRDFSDVTWQAFWRTAVQEEVSSRVAADLGLTPAAVRQAKCRVLRRLRLELAGMLGDSQLSASALGNTGP